MFKCKNKAVAGSGFTDKNVLKKWKMKGKKWENNLHAAVFCSKVMESVPLEIFKIQPWSYLKREVEPPGPWDPFQLIFV